jgi:flagellar hook-basal body complex protein FliE
MGKNDKGFYDGYFDTPKQDAPSWDSNSVPKPVTGDGPKAAPGAPALNPPNVPSGKGGGSGQTAVNTPSMNQFANNISQLLPPLENALKQLQDLKPLAAGGFYQGYNMRNVVTGNGGDGMLQSGFETVLKKAIKSINDTHEAVVKMAKDYETVDDQNKMTGQALNRAMGNVGADVNAVGAAGAKFGSGTNSGSGSGSGS